MTRFTNNLQAIVGFLIFPTLLLLLSGSAVQAQEYEYVIDVKREVHTIVSGQPDPIITQLADGRGVIRSIGDSLNTQQCGGCTVTLQQVSEDGTLATLFFTNQASSCSDGTTVVTQEGTFLVDIITPNSSFDWGEQLQWQACTYLHGYVWFAVEQREVTTTRKESPPALDLESDSEEKSTAATGNNKSSIAVVFVATLLAGLLASWNAVF